MLPSCVWEMLVEGGKYFPKIKKRGKEGMHLRYGLNEFTGYWLDANGAEHGFVALAVR